MITEDRLKHMLGVARKCYSISKELGYSEEFSKKMWFLGYIHDIGYEFVEPENHATESANILASMGITDYDTLLAVKFHGKHDKGNIKWKILAGADLQVDSKGNEVSVIERLNDIRDRYGETSDAYLTACDNAYAVGLTSYNFAGHLV